VYNGNRGTHGDEDPHMQAGKGILLGQSEIRDGAAFEQDVVCS
jgi:hypothetical protein